MKLILHLGLHRSGASAFQRFLNTHQKRFRKRRVLALSRRTVKHADVRVLSLVKGPHIGSRGPGANFAKVKRYLQSIAGDVDTVIFSDENMPGYMIGYEDTAFSRLTRFAAMLELLVERHDVHVVGVMREHADYLESVYRFSAARGEARNFADFIAGTNLDSVSFCGLLDTVAGAIGRERLHVFSHAAVKADGGEALLRCVLDLADTRLQRRLRLLPTNVSPDVTFLSLMQTLHRRGVVLPRPAWYQFNNRLVSTDNAEAGDDAIVEALVSEARRVVVPVTNRRFFRLVQHALVAGVPALRLSRSSARALLAEARDAADRMRQKGDRRAALKSRLSVRFEADRTAVGQRYLSEWQHGADSREAARIPPDARA